MTDEIFISEKTGKRYRFVRTNTTYHKFCGLPKEVTTEIKEIIEPKLEVGDTYTRAFSVLKSTDHDAVFYNALEIRKANGEIWQKVNNEWRQKK